MEDLQVQAGDIVASKYRVEKVLGVGGMGVVVAARHTALGNMVAIKMMQPRAFGVKGAAERFLREGQAAAQLASPHVAKVLDVGTLESGAPYMIMEHLAGSDLSSVIEKKGPVALHDAVEYILQACDAIGEAHAKGIVHRDLKPANLFLLTSPDGSPLIKVLDFGIAKVAGSDQKLTGTSQGMGSGGYMSPEQMSSAKKVDHRADIWALGITLYELLTAHLPFAADSLEQFVARVFFEQPTPLLQHRPDLPIAVEAILLRCLEKQPEARYSTVAHLAAALSPYAPPRALPYVERIARHLGVSAAAPAGASTPGTMLIPAVHPTGQTPGYPTGQTPGYPTGQTPGYPTGQTPGYPTGQTPGYPTGPGMAQSQPIAAVTSPGGMQSQPMMGASSPGAMQGQPMMGASSPGGMIQSQPMMGASSPGGMQGQPSIGGTAPGLSASQIGMAHTASVPQLPANIVPPAAGSRKTGLLVGVGAVAVIAIAAVVGLKFASGRAVEGAGAPPGSGETTTSTATTATATATPPVVDPAQTATAQDPAPAVPPSGAPDAGAPAVKTAAPVVKKPASTKPVPSADPFGGKPISSDRDPRH